MPPPDAKSRLAYIDWMRGLACLLMFQTHCYDSWLSPAARQSRFFHVFAVGRNLSRAAVSVSGGNFVCPGHGETPAEESCRRRRSRAPPSGAARKFSFTALLFRVQEYVVAWGWAPKSDLLRVDVLNTIGLSMMLMGVMCWLVLALVPAVSSTRGNGQPNSERPGGLTPHQPSRRLALVLAAAGTALLISLLTPLLWTTWRPRWLPWPLESYVDGVHNLGVPQAGIFPVFPWTGFAFAGLAVGFILQSRLGAGAGSPHVFVSLGVVGGGADRIFARWLDAQPRQLYRRLRLLAHQPTVSF